MKLDFEVLVPRIDAILARGLSRGLGTKGAQVCIEAAICEALNLPHGDDPQCVAIAVRAFKIRLNDSNWSSPEARAAGLRDLGIAQLGSLGVVNDVEFAMRMAHATIQILIPALFRQIFTLDTPEHQKCREAADRCAAAADAAAADAADAAAADARWAAAARWADAAAAAAAARWAAAAADDAAAADAAAAGNDSDHYLRISAGIALTVLREMKSPGCEWV
jgi:hypothetical protein